MEAPLPDSPPPDPRPSGPVRSAMREKALPAPPPPKGPRAERLREGALETLLNAAGLLKDALEDFQNSDRFFKYKAMVLGAWLVLTIATFGVACPGGGPGNPIKAELVIAGEAGNPVYMIKNDSEDPWTGVRVIVNGAWITTADSIGAGRDITLSPRLMSNEAGDHPPVSLKVGEIEVETDDGKVELLRGGRPR